MEFSKEQWEEVKRLKLESDTNFNFKKSDKGGYKQGKCPACGENSLWVVGKLIEIRCNHKNSCGYTAMVKDLYKDMFQMLKDKYLSKTDDPKGQARIYLHYDRKLDFPDTWFEQETALCKDNQKHYPTVRFQIAPKVKWERFIGYSGKHKANFLGKYKGLAWVPPGMKVKKGDQIWILEGIFNAGSLYQHKLKAIAGLSSNNIPTQFIEKHKGKDIKWVVGMDNDPVNENTGKNAGLEAAKKFADYLKELGERVEIAFTPEKIDWNDLHRKGKINEEAIEKAFWRGNLLSAKNTAEYGYYLSKEKKSWSFCFSFNRKIFCWSPSENSLDEIRNLDNPDDQKVIKEVSIRNTKIIPLSNFSLEFLYAEKNSQLGTTGYYFLIEKENERPDHVSIDSTDLAAKDSFKKAMLRVYPGAYFFGANSFYERLMQTWFKNKINVVKVLPWGGYDPATKNYIFREVAYDADGNRVLPNQYNFFEMPKDHNMKTAFQDVLCFNEIFDPNWYNDFFISYENNGLAALAFFFTSLFAEQFREDKKFFPFLALIGEGGAGKSTLIEFLWKLFGRDSYEGIPLSATSTGVGFKRYMEQVSNLPSVFLEDNELSRIKFNFEDFKASYNGRIMRVTGKKTMGSETNAPKFRSSVVVVQNHGIEGSSALRERFCEFEFNKKGFTQLTREASHRLKSIKVDNLAGFRHAVLSQTPKLLTNLIQQHEKGFNFLLSEARKHQEGPLSNDRIGENHALLLAGIKVLREILPISDTQFEKFKVYILDQAIKRQLEVRVDTHLVQLFFEAYEDFERELTKEIQTEDGTKELPILNHAKNPNLAAINLNEFMEACGKKQLRHFNDLAALRRELKESKIYKFLSSNTPIWSQILKRNIKCWVFQRPEM
jgi:hypothetical protein